MYDFEQVEYNFMSAERDDDGAMGKRKLSGAR